jgi:hypothetical protein
MNAIIGGNSHVIGGWSKYSRETHEVRAELGECLKCFYPNMDKIDGEVVVKKNVNTKKILNCLAEYGDKLKKSEKKLVNFDSAVTIPLITSGVLNYVINNSSMTDLYVLKSLYEDLGGKDSVELIDLYNEKLPCNNKNILLLEEKNADYMDTIEKYYVLIINLLNSL